MLLPTVSKGNHFTMPLLNLKQCKLHYYTSFLIITNLPAALQVHNEIPHPLKPPFVKRYK